jgi:hypothetical protein
MWAELLAVYILWNPKVVISVLFQWLAVSPTWTTETVKNTCQPSNGYGKMVIISLAPSILAGSSNYLTLGWIVINPRLTQEPLNQWSVVSSMPPPRSWVSSCLCWLPSHAFTAVIGLIQAHLSRPWGSLQSWSEERHILQTTFLMKNDKE